MNPEEFCCSIGNHDGKNNANDNDDRKGPRRTCRHQAIRISGRYLFYSAFIGLRSLFFACLEQTICTGNSVYCYWVFAQHFPERSNLLSLASLDRHERRMVNFARH